MSAIIKGSPALMNGQAQLVKYAINTGADGAINIEATFLALTSAIGPIIGQFATGSRLHPLLRERSDILSVLQKLNASAFPIVTEYSTTDVYGLTTINVRYYGIAINLGGIPRTVAQGAGQGQPEVSNTNTTNQTQASASLQPTITEEVTTSKDLRSFNGTVATNITKDENGVFLLTGTSYSFSFDYYSTTITRDGTGIIDGTTDNNTASTNVSQDGDSNESKQSLLVSEPINVRGGIDPLAYVAKQPITTTRTYRNNLGQTKTQSTTQGIYVQNRFLF